MSGSSLGPALEQLAQTLPRIQFPLPLAEATELRGVKASLEDQLRDYLLPRAAKLDAPLLAVVGGSTGAGKSTIVNSLLARVVTRPGVLRPTTKSPVLISHPDDLAWFSSDAILPGLVRSLSPVADSRALQIVKSDALPAGLAILDAPDIDSIDDENRKLSRQLLQAADLWLFVTSAARYADAVGWELLQQAAARNTVLSVVLNRCPPESVDELKAHLAQLMSERGLPAAKLFAVLEAEELPADGMVPLEQVQPIRAWLGSLAAEAQARSDVAIQTLAGSVKAIDPQLARLADGARRQVDAVSELRDQARQQFRQAADEISAASSDGSMLRGEVLSRWQDFVGTGEFMRGVEAKISAWRDRLTGWFTGKPQAEQVQVAISDGLAALLIEHGQAACEQVVKQWSMTPWGRDLISAAPDLAAPSPEFAPEAVRTIGQWQASVLNLVSEQGKGKRLKARVLALGTNALGAALIILVFATTGGLTTAEVGIAGGTSLLAQRLLEGIFGEDAVRRLAERAKADLDERVRSLLSAQLARYELVLAGMAIDEAAADSLTQVAQTLREAAQAAFADLTRPKGR